MEKIKTKLLIGIVLLLVLVNLASAAVEIVEDKVNLTVDYSNFKDEDQKLIDVSTSSFTLKNTGTENVTVTVNAAGLLTDYSVTSKQVEIPNGSTANVILTFKVPHKQNGGESKVGTVIITQNNNQVDSAELIQNTISMLRLDELKVEYIDTEDSTQRDTFDGDKDEFDLEENVQPGSEVALTFDIENLFDNKYDTDKGVLENIVITIEADDNDLFQDDFAEEFDLEDIEVDDNQDFSVSFTVNNEADAGDYTLDITLEGEDGKGSTYQLEKSLTLDLKMKRNDIQIITAKVSPDTITACDASFTFDLEIKNLGTKEQKFAGVSVYNPELEINENIQNLDLEEYSGDDNSWKKVFTFPIKKNLAVKTYPLEINSYIEQDETMDQEIVNVVIGECVEEKPTTTTPNEVGEENKTTTGTLPTAGTAGEEEETPASTTGKTDTSKISSSNIIETTEEPYTKEDFLFAIVIVVGVLLLALIIIFLIILFRK